MINRKNTSLEEIWGEDLIIKEGRKSMRFVSLR